MSLLIAMMNSVHQQMSSLNEMLSSVREIMTNISELFDNKMFKMRRLSFQLFFF